MNKKSLSVFLALACGLVMSVGAKPQAVKPVVFTLGSKIITGKLKSEGSDRAGVQGRAAFTLTSANDDDTLTGVMVYTLTDEGRGKLAQSTGRELEAVPASLVKKEVIANFRKGTACPIGHIMLPPTEFEVEGAVVQLDRVPLEINESHGQLPQLLCAWARQVNKKSQHHGIIAAINRLIRGEE